MPVNPEDPIQGSRCHEKLYTPHPDGYCGDEDNGQTSAWYVFSALGFYRNPGTDEYVFGSPLFTRGHIAVQEW